MVEQSGISVKTQTGTDHWTKTAAEGARVECGLFAESMPCPGGNAPRASCKHLGALFFALEECSRIGFTKERFMCTVVLQAYKRPSDIHIIQLKRIMPDQVFSEKLGIHGILYFRECCLSNKYQALTFCI